MPDDRYRMLVYCQDTPASGQPSRAVTLAHYLLRAHPHAEALLLTRNLATCGSADLPPRCDVVKLPTRGRPASDRPGATRHVTSDEPPRYQRMRAAMLRDIAREFQPHLMFVDNEPLGVQGELMPALAELSHQRQRPAIVFGLRDIRGAPAHVRPRWNDGGIYTALERFYHRIMVYGEQEVFDVASEYAMPPMLASRVTYCGYMHQAPARASDVNIRADLGVAADVPLIAVLADSGADGHMLLRAYIEALPHINERVRAHSVLITGALNAEAACPHLEALQASGLLVTVLSSYDTTALLNAARAVVCRGGYTSMVAALARGHHPLVIPRETRSGEQRLRATLFHEHGWCALLREHQLDAGSLADAVVALLERPIAPPLATFDPERVCARVQEAVCPLLERTPV